MAISKRKFKIGRTVSFAGYVLTPDGVHPDPKRISAITDFPSPKDVTSVRSFLGLANQLGQFIPDLAMATTKIRGLLKKGVQFQWLAEHEAEFCSVKQLLTSPMMVHYFDSNLPTSLLTDASKLNGLGYVLIQNDKDGKIRLIQAGSRSLAPAEVNYAPIEQECLAVVWAIERCKYFLYGCPEFRLVTDHQPLLGIFRKDIGEVENRRLQRFRERVSDYNFCPEWVEGKTHYIADALSRNPVENFEDQAYIVASVLQSMDPQLDDLRSAASESEQYQRLLNAVKNYTLKEMKNTFQAQDPIRQFSSYWDDLSVYTDGQLILYRADRLVVPTSQRQRILELLHRGHSGISKTRVLANQMYFWPSMSRDVKTMVSSCEECFESLPKQQRMPMSPSSAHYPLEATSADLFSYAGKTYLVLVDRFSGMIWCDKLSSLNTNTVTDLLVRWMNDFGFPSVIRTDGGPQFRGLFDDWCAQYGVTHELSSPYNPQSNGHAENGVKTAKTLLKKLDGNMRLFREHLFAWRNTPRVDGIAPSDLFFGRRQRSLLPSVSQPALSPSTTTRDAIRSQQRVKFDASASPLSTLLPGQPVAFYTNGAWGGRAVIEKARRDDQLSYEIILPDGTKTIRNRRLLRPVPNYLSVNVCLKMRRLKVKFQPSVSIISESTLVQDGWLYLSFQNSMCYYFPINRSSVCSESEPG